MQFLLMQVYSISFCSICFSPIRRLSSLFHSRKCSSMILQMRGRFGEGEPRCRRRKPGEKEMRSRVSTDESLLAVSDDLDRLTRMLGTCLSPVSRVNFASLYAISLSFSFSSLSRLIVDASISRKCGAAVRSLKWDFRQSFALCGEQDDDGGPSHLDPSCGPSREER